MDKSDGRVSSGEAMTQPDRAEKISKRIRYECCSDELQDSFEMDWATGLICTALEDQVKEAEQELAKLRAALAINPDCPREHRMVDRVPCDCAECNDGYPSPILGKGIPETHGYCRACREVEEAIESSWNDIRMLVDSGTRCLIERTMTMRGINIT